MAFGLLHGINPSHGWPVATLYSMRSRKPFLAGITSSSIIAGAHFVSSIVVVAAYLFLTTLIEIPQLYLRYAACNGTRDTGLYVLARERRRLGSKLSMDTFIMKKTLILHSK